MEKVKRIQRIKNTIRNWVDFDSLLGNAIGIKDIFTRLFVPQTPKHHENFDQAVKRLDLTPADIQKRMHSFKRLVITMLVISAIILIYTGYSLTRAYWIASILSFTLFILTLVFAFRYHFWYVQMQQRRLGMSFRQWFKLGLLKQSDKKDLEVK